MAYIDGNRSDQNLPHGPIFMTPFKGDPMFHQINGSARQSMANLTELFKRVEKIISKFEDFTMYDMQVELHIRNEHITILFVCSPAMAEYIQNRIGNPVQIHEGTISYQFVNNAS